LAGIVGAVAEVTYLEAIRSAMTDAMRDDARVFLIGEDVGHFGGPFGVSKGLMDEFGTERVIDTPIAEEGFVGAAFGAAWMGERPIAELQFADFISCAFDTIVTVGAKTHWRSGIKLPVVIRSPFGGGVRGGPFHASCPEGFFVGTAGLKVVCPGSVEDAYGLLRSSIEDDDPVLYFEHKALYRRLRAEAPDPSLRTPIGRARIARHGSDVTLVTYGAMVEVALRAAEELEAEASVEVLDLRTVWPLDGEAILASTGRTSRLCVLQEASSSLGVAGEVLSLVAREGFELLDAPPLLVAAPNSPVPFAPELEDAYIPSLERVVAELRRLGGY
jgi:2-oxoisovalerate dehydrogenase E1 component beta subunit